MWNSHLNTQSFEYYSTLLFFLVMVNTILVILIIIIIIIIGMVVSNRLGLKSDAEGSKQYLTLCY